MYRRNAAATPRRGYVGGAATTILAAVAAALPQGIFETAWNAAWREHRQRARFAKRSQKHTTYHRMGLNGPRAVARRLRQLQNCQLQVTPPGRFKVPA
jgi:hypothetical protein